MKDDEYLNILTYGRPTGTISIMPHPEDIIDVDPVIIAKMKARLKGEDFNHAYDVTDRVIDEISLQREKSKLKKIFGSELQTREAFSSIKNIHSIHEELVFEEVDKNLLADYAYMKSRETNVDEIDFINNFLFDKELLNKEQRISFFSQTFNSTLEFSTLIEEYKTTHFEVLKVTKEAIQLNSDLQKLFNERKLAHAFDRFLKEFYGMKSWVN